MLFHHANLGLIFRLELLAYHSGAAATRALRAHSHPFLSASVESPVLIGNGVSTGQKHRTFQAP